MELVTPNTIFSVVNKKHPLTSSKLISWMISLYRDQCSILKSPTPVKCHFGCQKSFLFFGHFTKMCSAKFPPIIWRPLQKHACHKVQWLQFANRTTNGLQSWHSSIHFQIQITLAIQLCNFDSALTATSAWQALKGCKKKVWNFWVKSDYFETLHIEMHVQASNFNTDCDQ